MDNDLEGSCPVKRTTEWIYLPDKSRNTGGAFQTTGQTRCLERCQPVQVGRTIYSISAFVETQENAAMFVRVGRPSLCAEGNHLHDPRVRRTDRGRRAVAPHRRHELVFDQITVWYRKQSAGKAGTWTASRALNQIRAE